MAFLTISELQEIASAIFPGWVRELQLELRSSDQHGVQLALPFAAAISHLPTVVSGQALLAVADSAMVLALASFYGEFRPVATVDLHMQFLRAAKGNIVAVANVNRATKTIAFATVSFYQELDRTQEIARAIGTFSVPSISHLAEGSKS